jgi:hypothetical protein
VGVLVYRPDGAVGRRPFALAPPPATLSGVRLAVLDNGKPNAVEVMTFLADALAARAGARRTAVVKKGPAGLTANAAIPCAPDSFARVLDEADVVVTGTADCGSCTAYSVGDAIELEKAGRPTLVVTTTRFRPIAEALAASLGLPALRLLSLPHPIGGTDLDTLRDWATSVVDDALALFSPTRPAHA